MMIPMAPSNSRPKMQKWKVKNLWLSKPKPREAKGKAGGDRHQTITVWGGVEEIPYLCPVVYARPCVAPCAASVLRQLPPASVL